MERRTSMLGGSETVNTVGEIIDVAPIAPIPYAITNTVTGDTIGSGEVLPDASPTVSYAEAEQAIRDTTPQVTVAGETGAPPITVARSLISDYIDQSRQNFAARVEPAQPITTDEAVDPPVQPSTALEVAPATTPPSILDGFVKFSAPLESEPDEEPVLTEPEIEAYLGQIADFLTDQPVSLRPEITDDLVTDETADPAPKPEFGELTEVERTQLFGEMATFLAAQEPTIDPADDDQLHQLPSGAALSLAP